MGNTSIRADFSHIKRSDVTGLIVPLNTNCLSHVDESTKLSLQLSSSQKVGIAISETIQLAPKNTRFVDIE